MISRLLVFTGMKTRRSNSNKEPDEAIALKKRRTCPTEKEEQAEILLKKIAAIHTINQEIAERIKQNESFGVPQYSYQLDFETCDVQERKWIRQVSSIIASWSPKTELVPLPEGGNAFDLNYDIKEFEDLTSFNDQLLKISSDVNPSDEKAESILNAVFSNIRTVQAFLGEIETLLMAPQESSLEEVRASFNQFLQTLQKVNQSKILSAAFPQHTDPDDAKKQLQLKFFGRSLEEALSKQSELFMKQCTFHFTHSSDFDTNGLFYWLGTLANRKFSNPVKSGLVSLHYSHPPERTRAGFHPEKLLSRETGEFFWGSRTAPQWVVVDLGPDKLFHCSHYTLRHGWHHGYFINNWRFEGRNENADWKVLHQETDIPFKKEFETKTFPTVDTVEMFRYFRVIQLDRDSAGTFDINISGIELYGTLVFVQ